jgi:cellulose biosynthesis protein BcsQ
MDAKERGNTNLVLLGVVISGVDKRTSLANSLSDFVEQSFRIGQSEESVKFKSTIGRSTVIPQTQKVGKTLFETHSTHKVTDEYRLLAREIEARLEKIESAGAEVGAGRETGPAPKEVVNG